MKNSENLATAIKYAIEICDNWHHEFVTPEHVLFALCGQESFGYALFENDVDIDIVEQRVRDVLKGMEHVPVGVKYAIEGSEQFTQMMSLAIKQAQYADVDVLDVPHVVAAMFMLDDSNAAYILHDMIGDRQGEFMKTLLNYYNMDLDEEEFIEESEPKEREPWRQLITCLNDSYTQHNPLIGREQELERTIQGLCRKDKNNPLHVGI